MAYKYYKIVGMYEGEFEMLYGSYDHSDIENELETEKDQWKEEGYKKIHVEIELTDRVPDPEVYGDDFIPNIV